MDRKSLYIKPQYVAKKPINAKTYLCGRNMETADLPSIFALNIMSNPKANNIKP